MFLALQTLIWTARGVYQMYRGNLTNGLLMLLIAEANSIQSILKRKL